MLFQRLFAENNRPIAPMVRRRFRSACATHANACISADRSFSATAAERDRDGVRGSSSSSRSSSGRFRPSPSGSNSGSPFRRPPRSSDSYLRSRCVLVSSPVLAMCRPTPFPALLHRDRGEPIGLMIVWRETKPGKRSRPPIDRKGKSTGRSLADGPRWVSRPLRRASQPRAGAVASARRPPLCCPSSPRPLWPRSLSGIVVAWPAWSWIAFCARRAPSETELNLGLRFWRRRSLFPPTSLSPDRCDRHDDDRPHRPRIRYVPSSLIPRLATSGADSAAVPGSARRGTLNGAAALRTRASADGDPRASD